MMPQSRRQDRCRPRFDFREFVRPIVVIGVLAGLLPVPAAGQPGAGAGAWSNGKYRNIFAEAGYSQVDIDARVARAWNQLFHGNPDTERLYTPAGQNANGPLAYIPDIQHTDVRSEGMSYGMMIAVQLDKKAEFDALWNWSMTYMYQANPAHPTYGFFSWQLNYDGSVISELPAPDGEEYYAMALYFAANRWGNGTGIYDYKAQADRLLRHMVHREPIKGPVKERAAFREHTVGKEVNDEHAMILFSPDERNGFTDVSYHLPAFYELWALWGPEEDRAFWARAARASRDMFVKAADAKTGLVPNMSQFDGTPFGSTRFPASFREDAWRVAMNWTVDWSWWAKDPRQRELSDRLQAFFESKGLETYGDNWNLDGTVIRERHSPGLVATNGLASLAATDKARAKKFVDELWKLDVPSSTVFRYYDGLLYLMSLMHASGRFQIIRPATTAAEAAAVARRAAQEERLAASYLLAFGRTPTTAEVAAGMSREPATVASLLEQQRAAIRNDAALERDVIVRAGRDAFGVSPGDDDIAGLRGTGTYTALMQRHVKWLAEHQADYERVLHRAYRTHLARDAYSIELDYWKKYPALPYVFLVGCVENWALRNQPGLMATAGVPSVSVNSGYLSTARLSPAVAAEARSAAGLPPSGPADLAHHIVAAGAEPVVSVGGIHFVAAGASDWRPPQPVRPVASVAGDWRLVWSDEFERAIGPDWVFDIGRGGNGWGNNESQFYTDRKENARVENGVLIIEARKEAREGAAYTSARLKTAGRKTFKYGRLEARIQIPRGQGIWPAFWALGEDITTARWPTCGEIDVMENIGKEPSIVHGTVHGPQYSGGKGVGAAFSLPSGAFADAFHVFAVDWEPASLTFSVDGKAYRTITPADLSGRWVFDHPFFLLLNLAVGGNWPGAPDATTPFPAQMKIDYVRVYERVSPGR
jgi:oligosaccharide reducing-end xylanase